MCQSCDLGFDRDLCRGERSPVPRFATKLDSSTRDRNPVSSVGGSVSPRTGGNESGEERPLPHVSTETVRTERPDASVRLG